MAKCPICGGTGDTTNNIPPTNEQWFCTLSTEEKAKVMVEVSTRDSLITKIYYEYLLKEITEWLKQPHRNE